MNEGPNNDTSPRVRIPPEVLAEMREEFDRQTEYRKIETLDQIRLEYGIGWAIYCSAFMGREVDNWRVDVCEALNG